MVILLKLFLKLRSKSLFTYDANILKAFSKHVIMFAPLREGETIKRRIERVGILYQLASGDVDPTSSKWTVYELLKGGMNPYDIENYYRKLPPYKNQDFRDRLREAIRAGSEEYEHRQD